MLNLNLVSKSKVEEGEEGINVCHVEVFIGVLCETNNQTIKINSKFLTRDICHNSIPILLKTDLNTVLL